MKSIGNCREDYLLRFWGYVNPETGGNEMCMWRRLSNYPSKKDTPKIEVTMEPDEESNYTPEEKATYQKISVL